MMLAESAAFAVVLMIATIAYLRFALWVDRHLLQPGMNRLARLISRTPTSRKTS